MVTNVEEYSKTLAEQLRLNGMKEEQVRDVVAEVRDHVATTGDDPLVTFGQPAAYASTWVEARPVRWLVRMVAAVAGVTAIVALPRALLSAGPWGSDVEFGSPEAMMWMMWVGAWAIMPWSLEVWLARRRGQRLGTRRWTNDIVVGLVVVTGIVAAVWLLTASLWDDDVVLLTVPRWLVIIVGLCSLPGLAFIGRSNRRTLPEPPGPVTWKSRLRRAFWTG